MESDSSSSNQETPPQSEHIREGIRETVAETAAETVSTENLTRKRKYLTIEERQERDSKAHPLLPACTENCRKKCNTKFHKGRRTEMNKEFWQLSYNQRRQWIVGATTTVAPARRQGDQVKPRTSTYYYKMRDSSGKEIPVCKTFFLQTLGYKGNNNSFIQTMLKPLEAGTSTALDDKRGKHSPKNKIDRQSIKDHIESFHPSILHYCRVHAPNRRYVPTDLNIKYMYDDYLGRNPAISFELYRQTLKAMNVSFTKSGEDVKGAACMKFT